MRKWWQIMGLCALLMGMALGGDSVLLTLLRHYVFDSYQRLHPRPYEDAPVVIVDIDEASLKRLGQWPWPRPLVASLLEKLQSSGVAAIGLDIVMQEPDRTSPAHMLEVWEGLPSASRKALKHLPDHDALFTLSLMRTPTVVGVALEVRPDGECPTPKIGVAELSAAGDAFADTIYGFSGSVNNLPAFNDAASGIGMINALPDADGILRKVPLLLRCKDVLIPSLSVETLRLAEQAGNLQTRMDAMGARTLRIGQRVIQTQPDATRWLYYTGTRKERYVSAWEVMQGRISSDRLSGMIALVGTSATGLRDLRSTPLDSVISGVEIHAEALEQIILGVNLSRPDWAWGAEVLCFALFTMLELWLIAHGKMRLALLLLFGIGGGVAWGAWKAFTLHGLLFDPLSPMLAVGMLVALGAMGRYRIIEHEKSQIRGAFGRYLSPQIVAKIAKDPSQLHLGGEERQMSVMFTDIRGFTTFAETMNASELTAFINAYLTPMSDIVLRYEGTIDKYIGDAIMAFWNAPLDDPLHAFHACQTALAMHDALFTFNQSQKHPISIGVGINTGICCVGNLGSAQRLEYSVLGDSVNLASRLEGLCKYYGVGTVLGEQTVQQLGEAHPFAIVPLDLMRVKGKKRAVTIYALLGAEALTSQPLWQTLAQQMQQMLTHYRNQRFAEAMLSLDATQTTAHALALTELDTLWNLYRTRISHFRATPPEADWDGVYDAKEK